MNPERKTSNDWWRASNETIGVALASVLCISVASVVQNPEIQRAIAGGAIFISGTDGAMLFIDRYLKNKK